jgi:hypothetical protein
LEFTAGNKCLNVGDGLFNMFHKSSWRGRECDAPHYLREERTRTSLFDQMTEAKEMPSIRTD